MCNAVPRVHTRVWAAPSVDLVIPLRVPNVVGLSYVHSLKWYITVEDADVASTSRCSSEAPAEAAASGAFIRHPCTACVFGFVGVKATRLTCVCRLEPGAVFPVPAGEAVRHSAVFS